MFVRCPFCHKYVFRWFYKRHERQHSQRGPDGQLTEHVTLRPTARFGGSLENVPQSYRHVKCGRITAMPEDVIRSYLVDPLLYNDNSFCDGCGCYVWTAELVWTETGESVLDYMRQLRAEYLRRTFGIDVRNALSLPVAVTPPAVKAIRAIARSNKFAEPYYLTIRIGRQGEEIRYVLDVANKMDPALETCFQTAGIYVVVDKEQENLLAGTLVHYSDQPGSTGFQITSVSA